MVWCRDRVLLALHFLRSEDSGKDLTKIDHAYLLDVRKDSKLEMHLPLQDVHDCFAICQHICNCLDVNSNLVLE